MVKNFVQMKYFQSYVYVIEYSVYCKVTLCAFIHFACNTQIYRKRTIHKCRGILIRNIDSNNVYLHCRYVIIETKEEQKKKNTKTVTKLKLLKNCIKFYLTIGVNVS